MLDWTGNTNHSANNTSYASYNPSDKHRKFDGKNIVAEIHTHPKSYYIEKGNDGVHNYDGNSVDDYIAARNLGVPVYSIGPTTVSVITGYSLFQSEDDFNNLAKGTYKDTIPGQVSADCNPFFWRFTSQWLNSPEINTAK